MSKVTPVDDEVEEFSTQATLNTNTEFGPTDAEDLNSPSVKMAWINNGSKLEGAGKPDNMEDAPQRPVTPLEGAANLDVTASDEDATDVSAKRQAALRKLRRSSTAGDVRLAGSDFEQKTMLKRSSTRLTILVNAEGLADLHDEKPTWKSRMKFGIAQLQKYSLPLISGVMIALVWSNVDEVGYHAFIDSAIHPDLAIDGHGISLHFIVNDFFMCFFFGLAIKEVTEALLPGGSLSPISRAVNPLVATLGGVLGPVAVYLALVAIMDSAGALEIAACLPEGYDAAHADDDHHRRLAGGGSEGPAASAYTAICSVDKLLNGWGVPTATDISLAWMFALQIFGIGHPAINFMLLLAILDDALGMIIIACAYSDPNNPVEPIWLLFVVLAMVLGFGLRKLDIPLWQVYIIICGPVSWIGLFKAHVHPALSLVFVVPFMPAGHAIHADPEARDLGRADWGHHDEEDPDDVIKTQSSLGVMRTKSVDKMKSWMGVEEEAPLHVFEHSMKLPVDIGMFFFGLANAGVKMGSVGGITLAVLVSLLFGKMAGISLMSLLAVKLGFPLPPGLGLGDLLSLSALGGIGLTVALFVSNEAFVQPELRGQAKMGAVLSVFSVVFAWGIRRVIPGEEVDNDD
mmetsp:Transcript_87125/g.154195  ORF Transcript_87125/g.154195 Transcript_87125/m.154195 type:complete len:629 (+) Transcript_87125:45-1931(+)|eukprot:CAMPEP_0197629132 /NCGR_PEP_ID=MMETSP1338-20131121/7119_1 /TAXON_ID=43686 ORGANISM="Pelagodinium beii, Strain RCC1491" /NCGR_SAMPLE_ID=MMETSP1338 /ASSEMBLY_ACC=CAM_ASM_000754 /LENGTH=628 /DNA_ID=CAMNT_0043200149 /DNA_START=45 /DNA_END=1931 /DNA_ORIENTATION=+